MKFLAAIAAACAVRVQTKADKTLVETGDWYDYYYLDYDWWYYYGYDMYWMYYYGYDLYWYDDYYWYGPQCWANGWENEEFCESGNFLDEASCNANVECHWDV